MPTVPRVMRQTMVAVALACAGCSSVAVAPPPPAPVIRTVAELFEAIDRELAKPDAAIDVTRMSLWMAKIVEPDIDVEAVIREIDALAERARPGVARAGSLNDKIKTINAALFDEAGLATGMAHHRWISQLLRTHQGQCVSMSMLYAAVAQRLGLDARLVPLPEHLMVRLVDGSHRINIEATAKGATLSDADYEARFGCTAGPWYLHELTKRELVAVLLSRHLAYDLAGMGRRGDALACAARALTLCAIDPGVYGNYGVELRAAGRTQEAIEAYDAALKLDSTTALEAAKTWNNRANAVADCGRIDEALENYDRALRCDPRYAGAMANKAGLLLRLGRVEEALKLCEAALEIDPRDRDALVNMATGLGSSGRDGEALPFYDRALAIDPKNAVIWSNRSNTLSHLDRYEEALAGYEQALKIAPAFVGALANRGVTLYKLGRPMQAIASFDAAIAAEPRDSRAWISKSAALYETGQPAEALRCVEKAAEHGVRIPADLVEKIRRAAQK